MSTPVTLTTRNGVAVITIDNPPVNALSPGVTAGLRKRIGEASIGSGSSAIVIAGAGRTFPAGADIRELEDAALGKAPRGGPPMHDLLRQIEDCTKPVVMALHGTALGGGNELAMAGHYRVAAPETRMGQPEVTLGIIPGAEGTQRLPRLTGIEHALEMCVSGRPVSSRKALEIGLIDRIVEGDLLDGAIAFAREVSDTQGTHPRTRTLSQRLGSDTENKPLYENARVQARKFWRGMSAPLRVIEAIQAAATLSFEEGCQREREIAAECLDSDECRALIHAFFAERRVRKVPDLPDNVETVAVSRAGVVGAGIMGTGIAMTLANAGIRVRLTDVENTSVERGMSGIRKNYERSVSRGRLTRSEVEDRLRLIHPQVGYEGFGETDLVVEAAFEDMDLKRDIFRTIDEATPPNAILASNTSTLDIDQIAGATSRPGSVVGLHFFNPAHVMRLVEIVRGPRTGQSTLATVLELAKKLRKVGVVVGNCRGFVGNRMMLPYMREAQFLVEEGATPEAVDQALSEFGMAMGIFAVDDMGGLDLQWRVREEDIRLGLGGDRPLRVLQRLCEMGRLGQKTGRGWYRYEPGNRTPLPDPDVLALVEATAREAGIERRAITPEEVVGRCVYSMINEGARILEEGHALRASDIDVIYLTGYGFPRWRGGPMWYADTVGLPQVLQRIDFYYSAHGANWEPAPLLQRLVSEGRGFRDLDAEAIAGARSS